MSYHHIYNRGAHKVPIFRDGSDYWRMLKLLYLANSTEPFQLRDYRDEEVFGSKRKETLVDIVAYCLMPNHIHIALKPRTELAVDPGITKFMKKLCTGYSMYFNVKYDHSGTIWQGRYKKKISDDDDEYLLQLISYIHLNPYGIKEPEMTKDARKEHPKEAWEYSKEYEFSSLKDYLGKQRRQTIILCQAELEKRLNAEVQHQSEVAPQRGFMSGNI